MLWQNIFDPNWYENVIFSDYMFPLGSVYIFMDGPEKNAQKVLTKHLVQYSHLFYCLLHLELHDYSTFTLFFLHLEFHDYSFKTLSLVKLMNKYELLKCTF